MPRKNKILWVWRSANWAMLSPAKPMEAWGGLWHPNALDACLNTFQKACGFTPTETPERIRLSVERLDRE